MCDAIQALWHKPFFTLSAILTDVSQMLLWKMDQFKKIAPQGDELSSIYYVCCCVETRMHVVPVVTDAVAYTSGWSLRLDLTVRSIRCLKLSPGFCLLEAHWQTIDQVGFCL